MYFIANVVTVIFLSFAPGDVRHDAGGTATMLGAKLWPIVTTAGHVVRTNSHSMGT